MKYLVALAVLYFLASLGVSAMPYVRVLGVTPDLVLILAACWAVVRGQNEAMVVVPMAGVLRDLTSSDPLGTSVLGLAPIVPLAALVQLRAVESQFLPAVAVVFLGTCFHGIVSMTVLAATGQTVPVGDGVLRVVIPQAVVNALFTIIVYLPVIWLSPKPRPGPLGARRWLSST